MSKDCPRADIPYDIFTDIDIRAETTLSVEPLAGARKPATVLEIDFGPAIGRKRSSAQTTVHYTPETLVGRQAAAVVDFAPKRIVGFVSDVLVLCFPDSDLAAVLVEPERAAPNGARVS